jgi:predicted dienelactone hydrolase
MKCCLRVLLLVLAVSSRGNAAGYNPLETNAAPVSHVDLMAHDAARSRDIPVRVYLPAKTGATPVVIFSHGLGGTREGSPFMGEHWAARGYVAVFLQHPGSDDSVWTNQPPERRLEYMRRAVNIQNFMLRVQDVRAVLDQLEKWNADPTNALAGRLDMKKVGMSGHSFGAVTTEAVSGETFMGEGQSFTDPRIVAALMCSPSTPRNMGQANPFTDVKIPWMLMTGTKDIAPIGGADLRSRRGVYPALHGAPKYELVLDNAEHSVFTDRPLPFDSEPRNPNHHRVILALSTAFWDAYLRGDKDALAWLNGPGPRSVMEAADQWQFAPR